MTRRYLRDRTWGTEPNQLQPEYVPRTENEETRRAARDWLRERSDDDVPEFEDNDHERTCIDVRY
jgi:hypothetical protein